MARNKTFTAGFDTNFGSFDVEPASVVTPISTTGTEAKKPEPKTEAKPQKTASATKNKIQKKKKETKSVHKNFLITPTLNEALKQLAEENEMTENEAINAILNHFFELEG